MPQLTSNAWDIAPGRGPVVATAIHAGHEVRPDLRASMNLDGATRRREEDPGTDRIAHSLRGLSPTGPWTWAPPRQPPARLPPRIMASLLPATVKARRSRFEVDLNRSRDQAVYRTPEQAWGLEVWRRRLDPEQIRESQALHDAFYRDLEGLLGRLWSDTGRFVVLDVHSYCHRRGGPDAAPDCPTANPEINVGTASIEHERWRPLVERFIRDLRHGVPERTLDVRENVKFGGGFFPRWINHRFGERGCALALEIKKIYVDEWSGAYDQANLRLLQQALAHTLPGLVEELARG